MRHTTRTFALAGALSLAVAACSTDMGNRADTSMAASTSGSSTVQSTGSGSGSTLDYDGLHNNNGNGEAGATPMPGSLGATSGEQIP